MNKSFSIQRPILVGVIAVLYILSGAFPVFIGIVFVFSSFHQFSLSLMLLGLAALIYGAMNIICGIGLIRMRKYGYILYCITIFLAVVYSIYLSLISKSFNNVFIISSVVGLVILFYLVKIRSEFH
ncbi:MAG: hypothetical protein ACYDBX_01245 [Patescibacteria group bacterium]